MMRENIVCYCQPPISKGVQFIHSEMFNVIQVLKTKFDVYVVARSHECYEWYLKEFVESNPEVRFINVSENIFDGSYHYGILSAAIKSKLKNVDNVFVFSAGMEIVTPFAKLKNEFDNWKDGDEVKLSEPLDGPICHLAEFLKMVISYEPKFFNRVVDYTEVDIGAVTGYPMKKFFYYATTDELKAEGFHKLHDSELFFNLGYKENVEKSLDFMYGWTVEVPERAYLSDFCFEHITQTDKVKLFCKDKYFSKYAPITTQLDSDEYYRVVESAKFSLIAPSTTPQNVPVFRIYEDLARKTIPIFMTTVEYWKAFDEEMCNFIRDNLVYDEKKEPDFNKFLYGLDYDNLWNKLMQLSLMKQNMDRKFLFDKILEELT